MINFTKPASFPHPNPHPHLLHLLLRDREGSLPWCSDLLIPPSEHRGVPFSRCPISRTGLEAAVIGVSFLARVRSPCMLISSCQVTSWDGKESLFRNKSKLSLPLLQPCDSCHVLISEQLQDSGTKDTIYKHDCETQGGSEQNKVLLLPENWRDSSLNIVTPWKCIFSLFFYQ